MTAVKELKNFVNGKFVDVKGRPTLGVENPATGELIAQQPISTKEDVDEAVRFAKDAFSTWSSMTIKSRAAIMFKFHSLVEEHSKELAQEIVKENGKNFVEALADVAKGNETAEWATSLPQMANGRVLEVSRGIQCMEKREALGVVAAIVPFNFPAMVPMWTIPISLVMGNCVILKPSEKVPCTMNLMVDLMIKAGVPSGVFQIVHGTVEVVTAMCDHPDITAVSFVGSSKVAEIVFDRCNKVNKRVIALGGAKNHLIALPDCDVGMVAKDIVASFAGCCGQRCMAASVLVVVDPSDTATENIEILQKIVEVASALKQGQEGGQVGPVIDELSLKRVTGYIDEADKDQSSKVVLDGRGWTKSNAKGYWVGPTIILHSNKADRALHDEIFGPVLSVIRTKTREEAIAIENANPYGNAACIYTNSGGNAEWFTKRFRAAMLGVNIGIPVPREPFSFGGLYGTKSKYGNCDITGDGAMEFFSNRIKITSKWNASYASSTGEPGTKRPKVSTDKANFDGVM